MFTFRAHNEKRSKKLDPTFTLNVYYYEISFIG